MTDRELVAAARHALVNLENEQELLRNGLLPRDHVLSHGALRFIIFNALESLEPVGTGTAARKQRRLHAILMRCDLQGEVHKSVIESLAISRRQFYRERHEALMRLATSIREHARNTETVRVEPSSLVMTDLGDAAEACIEALRAAGQYRQVWDEACTLAARVAGDPREIEFWLVASEAARFLADRDGAKRALATACELTQHESPWRSMWIGTIAMNLQWVDADGAGVRSTLERAMRGGPDEATLHGKEAVLLGIMLGTAARIEIDCGRWEAARLLLARASRLLQNGTAAKRTSLVRLSALIFRLSAQLGLHADGDRVRSVVGYRAALDAARASGELGNVAETAIHYAAALAPSDARSALPYADYGLEIARRYYRGDRLVELTLAVVPLLLRARGIEAATDAVAGAHSPGLGARDSLFLELARAKIAEHCGDFHGAIERSEATAASLFARGIDAWACDAAVVGIDACAKLGLSQRAARALARIADVADRARADTRARARRLGSLAAPNVMLPA